MLPGVTASLCVVWSFDRLVVLAANLVGDWVRDVLDPIVKRNRAAA